MTAPAIAIAVLFARFDATQLTAHPVRRAILDNLAGASLTIRELADLVGRDYKTVQHHARMLHRAGLLGIQREGRESACHVPEGPRVRTPLRAVAALRAVASGVGTPAALGRALGLPRGTAGSLLGALERRGLVAREGARFALTDAARAALPSEGFWRGDRFAAAWTAWSSDGSAATTSPP